MAVKKAKVVKKVPAKTTTKPAAVVIMVDKGKPVSKMSGKGKKTSC
jgi:hypothetical protein